MTLFSDNQKFVWFLLEPTKLAAQTQTYSGIFTNWLEKFYELPFPTIV